jgi:hypothetical protein
MPKIGERYLFVEDGIAQNSCQKYIVTLTSLGSSLYKLDINQKLHISCDRKDFVKCDHSNFSTYFQLLPGQDAPPKE